MYKSFLFSYFALVFCFVTETAIALRVYVAECPPAFQNYTDWYSSEDGSKVLGKLISRNLSLYDSTWQQIDKWWNFQMFRSSLRVLTIEEADMVFIPLAFTQIHSQVWMYPPIIEIFGNHSTYFPYMGIKPHVIVINGPHTSPPKQVFQHVNPLLWIVSICGPVGGYPNFNMNYTITPHWWRQHWSSHGREYHHPFNASEIKNTKKYLTSGSWGTRPQYEKPGGRFESRGIWKQQCLNHTSDCVWLEWTNLVKRNGTDKSVIHVSEVIDASWYNLIAKGDYFTRGSIFDMLTSNTIGVIETEVVPHLPFVDMFDYNEMLVIKKSNASVVEELHHDFNETQAMHMIKKKFYLRHLFQYSLYPKHDLVSFATRNVVHPGDDALTFTLKTLLRTWCNKHMFPSMKAKCAEPTVAVGKKGGGVGSD